MKKVIAIILAICMMAVFVPAFAISAADEVATVPTLEEAIKGKQKLVAFTASADNVEDFASIAQGAQVNGGSTDCGFLDGNVYFDRANAKTLMSALSDDEVLTYVDGKPAAMAPNHAGILDRGLGGGYQLSIFKAGFKPGSESTVTLVFGNTGFYTQFVVSPNFTSLYYDSSFASIRGAKATVTVEGADIAAAYKVGDTVDAQLHDDHNTRTFTVASVSGNKVVFTCDDFAETSKTLLEIGKGTDRAFCVVVDENLPGGVVPAPEENQTFYAAYQTKAGKVSGSDWRFIFSAELAELAKGYAEGNSIMHTAKVSLSFNKGDAVVKTFEKNFSDLDFMYEVEADGEYYVPTEGCALFGFIIRGVPTFAWTSYSLKITKGDDVLLNTSDAKPLEETVALGGYTWLQNEQNVHAGSPENPTQGDRPGNNEGAWRFFDKTEVKAGLGGSEGNNGKIVVTWNYEAAKTVSLYALYTGNDSTTGKINKNNTPDDESDDYWDGSYIYRNPISWVLYGSSDGVNFNEIDVLTADEVNNREKLPYTETSIFANEGGWATYFTVDNPQAYQYYKIEFTTYGNQYFQLAEIKMFETAAEVAYNFNDTISGATNLNSNPHPHYAHEGLTQLFDGNKNTKFGYYANTNGVTVTWQYDAPVKVAGYGIVTANDSTRQNRNPNGWKLFGSTNGVDWVELDDVSSSTLFSNELLIFGVDSPDFYQYYKIEFKVNNHQFQMADIILYN